MYFMKHCDQSKKLMLAGEKSYAQRESQHSENIINNIYH